MTTGIFISKYPRVAVDWLKLNAGITWYAFKKIEKAGSGREKKTERGQEMSAIDIRD